MEVWVPVDSKPSWTSARCANERLKANAFLEEIAESLEKGFVSTSVMKCVSDVGKS